jgi:hypothetical protein
LHFNLPKGGHSRTDHFVTKANSKSVQETIEHITSYAMAVM